MQFFFFWNEIKNENNNNISSVSIKSIKKNEKIICALILLHWPILLFICWPLFCFNQRLQRRVESNVTVENEILTNWKTFTFVFSQRFRISITFVRIFKQLRCEELKDCCYISQTIRLTWFFPRNFFDCQKCCTSLIIGRV